MVSISYTLGARGTARLSFKDTSDDTASAFRADTDDPLSILDDAGTTTLFTGYVLSVKDRALGEPNIGVESAVDAVDLTRAFDNRIITTATFPTGTTMRDIVDHIVAYVSTYGVTRDAGMATGPALDGFTLDYVSVTDALNHLSGLTGYPWRLTPSLVLEMFSPGSKTAAFSLTSSNATIMGGVQWTKSKKQKINRVYVKYGGERQIQKTQSFTATASQTSFTLDYPAAGANLRGYITVDSVFTPLGAAPWTWDAGTNSILHASGATAGTIVDVTYDAQFPLIATAVNGDAATEPLEVIHLAPEVFDKDEAQQLAEGLLARYEAAPRVLTVKTRAGFEMPGTTITLDIPERTISSGPWLITAVDIRSEVDQNFTYTYTCAEGSQAVDSWIDSFRAMLGTAKNGSGVFGGTVSGELLPALTGRFDTEVIALSGLNTTGTRESRLSNWLNASLEGPATILGRPDSTHAWAIVADHLAVSPDIKRLRWVPIPESTGERFVMQLTQANTPVAGEYYLTPNTLGSLFLGANSTQIGLGFRITGIYATDMDLTNGMTELGRSVKSGFWTSVAHNAANFTAVGGGSWTVDSADQVTFAYALFGKTMTIAFTITNTDVTGVANELNIAIPGGFTSVKRMDGTCWIVDAGTREVGQVIINASGTVLRIFRMNAGAFTVTAGDNTAVVGQVTFEVP